jgi:cell division protein FtsW
MPKTSQLLAIVYIILVSCGFLALLSASTVHDLDSSYYAKRQALWSIVSIIIAFFIRKVDYNVYKNFAIPISLISIILLVLVLIPNIGKMVNGSWRWIQIGPITIQPSEFAKPSILILISYWLSNNQRKIDEFKNGILIPYILIGIFIVPILLEPDYGTTILIFFVTTILIFIAGANLKTISIVSIPVIVGIFVMILTNSERLGRIMAFLKPESYQLSSGYQLANSLRAFSEGKLFGVGFGGSLQKYDYLPEAHTDFIFPIIGEEFGLVGCLSVVILYLILFFLGINTSKNSYNTFGKFLGYGISLMIVIQVVINLFVVTGLAPTKGIALPFISYGGSSILSSSIMIGILLNISLDGERSSKKRKKGFFKNNYERK